MSKAANGEHIAVGLDLGGTTFIVGLLAGDGSLMCHRTFDTPSTGDTAELLDTLASAAGGLVEDTCPTKHVAGMGIGIPGPVDPQTGTIMQCPNLHMLDGVHVVKELERRTGWPTHIGNDAFCATLAELRYGAGRDHENVVLLTLGTGVGGGIAINNRVMRGPRRIMGEVGHLIIEPDGPPCGCGNFGCLEALAARDAIIRHAARALEQGRNSRLSDIVGAEHQRITPRIIAELAREGDALCADVMNRVGYYIGLALCNIIVCCDPDIILLGGGIAAAGEVLFEPVRRTVMHRSHISRFNVENIVPATLGNLAGVYGAGALVWEHHQAD